MSETQEALEKVATHAIAPQDLKPKFTRIGLTGATFDREDFTVEEWLEEGERIAGSYDFVAASKPFVIGDFILAGESKFGEMYSQAMGIFKIPYDRLKNIVYGCRNVPPERRSASLKSFEHHYLIASFTDQEQETLIQRFEEGTIDENTGKRRALNLTEAREAVRIFKREKAAALAGGKAPEPVTSVPAFTFSFHGPEPNQSINTWGDLCDAHYKEAKRRYMDPKYAEKAEAKERSLAFKKMLEDVPKADQAQFVALFDSGEDIKKIKATVALYKKTTAELKTLDALLEKIPEDQRARFHTMQAEGRKVAEIRSAINKFLDSQKALKAVQEQLDASGVRGDDRDQFLNMLPDKAVSNIKTEIRAFAKRAAGETKRMADITEILNGVPEAERGQFLEKAHAGASAKSIKEEVTAWQSVQRQNRKQELEANKKQRKEWRAQAQGKLKSANVLKQSNDKADLERAEVLDQEAQVLLEKAEESEAADKALTGVAEGAGPKFKKPGVTKKASKAKAKGRKR